ncbi:hypothetical protein WH95_03770 [Kiloniella litopenaei]|uniref:DUF4336 domain-containing protein n=1 Tax=Kiloniella litopenaei TaxID=1549748 RepID=A0A0M2RD86_9PROT|nr:DUF4336 domain-containing protein [Kiloniella litopenaei]KKJ78414.1 hypothetical protein WH95_03770 [Kiloniella litopenaei]
MTSGLYTPINTLKPIGQDIWIADGPSVSFYGIPFPTRMTVVRLDKGKLWVHSPIAINKELLDEINLLGDVKHLIAPNNIHYLSVGKWQEMYPDAQVWAAPNVADRAKKYNVAFPTSQELGNTPPKAWYQEIDQVYVQGNKILHEIDFFHKKTKTLVLTDLIENFEAQKLPWYFAFLCKLAGNLSPDGKAPIDMRLAFSGGRSQAREAIAHMISWKPEKIILAHGKWYDKNGTAELKRAFRWLLS